MTTCAIDGCDGKAKTRGWCHAHYMRWYTTGSTGSPVVVRREKGRTCSLNGCERAHQGRGYCDGHLRRFILTGEPGPVEFEPRNPGSVCSIADCDNPHVGKGLCDKHLQRLRKTGSATTPLPQHPANWTGNAATYNAVHLRLRKARGKARDQVCKNCGAQAEHWSYDYSEANPKRDPDRGPYSLDLSRYRPLCQPCHRRFDAEQTRTKGCSVKGCERPHKARGMCDPHYRKALAAER